MQNTCQRKDRDAKDEMTLTLRWSSARLASYYSVQAGDVLMQDEVDVEVPRKRQELANKCKRNPHGHSAAGRTAMSDKKVMSQVILTRLSLQFHSWAPSHYCAPRRQPNLNLTPT